MKKAQSAVEFVILFSFMILIFAGFFIAIQAKIVDTTETKDTYYLEEVNNIFVTEASLAARAPTDYHRSFYIPTHIKGKAFTMELVDDMEVVINYEDKEYVNFLTEPVKGEIRLGENTIHHLDGWFNYHGSPVHVAQYEGLFLNVNPEICFLYDDTEINGFSLCVHAEYLETFSTDLCRDLFGLCD